MGSNGSIDAARPEETLVVLGDGSALTDLGIAVGIVFHHNSDDQAARIIGSAQAALGRCGSSVASMLLAYDNSTPERRVQLPADVNSFASDANRGFGAGHNALMAAAFADGADIYVGANPDGGFHPDAIAAMARMHQAAGGTALIEAQQFPDDNLKYYDPETLETAWVSGACFLVPKPLFEVTGGFDERIFLYCEDVDFSWMARRAGFKLLHCPKALFHHDVSERGDEDWRYEWMCLSGRYLAQKWGSDSFREWCEGELRASGLHGPWPALDDVPRLPEADPSEADHRDRFRHRFAFSPMR